MLEPTEFPKKKRASKTYEVRLKKSVWIDGECIGNQDAVMNVEKELRDRLKASGVIYEK